MPILKQTNGCRTTIISHPYYGKINVINGEVGCSEVIKNYLLTDYSERKHGMKFVQVHEKIPDEKTTLKSIENAEKNKKLCTGNLFNLVDLPVVKIDITVPQPLISIVTCTYDREETLLNLAESLKNQTISNWEWIVIGDGGKDMSEALRNSGVENYKYIHLQNNVGLYSAQLIGLKKTKGEYICCIDDDDIYLPDALETMLAELSDSDIDVVFARCKRAFDLANRKSLEGYPSKRLVIDLTLNLMYKDNFNHESARMFKRECFGKIGYPDSSLTFLGDWEYGIRLARFCKYKYIDKIVSHVIVSKEGMTAKNTGCREWKEDAIKIKAMKSKTLAEIIKPIISIIIPLYNSTKWSCGAVKAALRCSNKYPVEVILIDDHSPEKEYEELRGIIESNGNIIYKRLPKNKGISGALNEGIKLANGMYLSFHGGDDELYPGKMDLLVEPLKEPGNVLAYGDADSLDEFGQHRLRQQEYNKETLLINNYIGKFMLWKADILKKTGLFNPRLKVALDWDMWLKMSKYGEFKHVKAAVGMQRIHDKSTHVVKYDICTKEIKRVIKKHTGRTDFILNGHSVEWKR